NPLLGVFFALSLTFHFTSGQNSAETNTQDHSPVPPGNPSGQSVIFLHHDGAGLSGWNIHRILEHGPDGYSHWDLLPQTGVYRSHMRDHLNASSHGGGTIHAYGVKVLKDSYGMNGKEPLVSASGYPGSVMMEAKAAGLRVGIINSGHLAEPGTGCMLASVERRADRTTIAAQLIESGADLIFGGGEVLFLPQGKDGVHGSPGIREDGRNLVEEAQRAGYTVIYHVKDLEDLSSETEKILGLFAAEDTYNDESEEELKEKELPFYDPDTPTIAEMTEGALRWFSASPTPFFLTIEEEGTDNFSNNMNAPGAMEAFRRADEAVGVARKFVAAHADLTLLVAADSEASSPALVAFGLEDSYPKMEEGLKPLAKTTKAGAPLDGRGGTGTEPFLSKPDAFGKRHVFGISWIDHGDHYGGVLVRAEGSMADQLPVNLDNTDIYAFLRGVLFER
ncbi:MAG: alkaline phosphatase, partial [Verrucomicrobiota bacterium]